MQHCRHVAQRSAVGFAGHRLVDSYATDAAHRVAGHGPQSPSRSPTLQTAAAQPVARVGQQLGPTDHRPGSTEPRHDTPRSRFADAAGARVPAQLYRYGNKTIVNSNRV